MDEKYKSYCTQFPNGVVVNTSKAMTKRQVLLILKNLRQRIVDEELQAEDSNAIGDKYTECNWGLCGEDPQVYPEASMHTWPPSYDEEQRVAPISMGVNCHMRVPTQQDIDNKERYSGGCFHQCRVFNHKKQGFKALPSRAEALLRLDEKIKLVEDSTLAMEDRMPEMSGFDYEDPPELKGKS